MVDLEEEMIKIMAMGYDVYPFDFQCQIYDGDEMIIDCDFYNDKELNLEMAIKAFKEKYGQRKTIRSSN